MKSSLVPQVKIDWGTSKPPRQAFKSKLIGHIQVTLEHFYLPFFFLLGGHFFQNPWIHEQRALNCKHHFLAVCSSEVKEGPLISTKPGKVKCTQNYGVHPARTEKCSLSFQWGWKETVRGIISAVRELITASILGTAPLWVKEPSMWASTRLTVNSPIPINRTEHLVSVSAAR